MLLSKPRKFHTKFPVTSCVAFVTWVFTVTGGYFKTLGSNNLSSQTLTQ